MPALNSRRASRRGSPPASEAQNVHFDKSKFVFLRYHFAAILKISCNCESVFFFFIYLIRSLFVRHSRRPRCYKSRRLVSISKVDALRYHFGF